MVSPNRSWLSLGFLRRRLVITFFANGPIGEGVRLTCIPKRLFQACNTKNRTFNPTLSGSSGRPAEPRLQADYEMQFGINHSCFPRPYYRDWQVVTENVLQAIDCSNSAASAGEGLWIVGAREERGGSGYL